MTLEEIYREVIGICRKYNATKVVLYGSRAKQTYRPESDIDIAVSGVYRGLAGRNGKYSYPIYCGCIILG